MKSAHKVLLIGPMSGTDKMYYAPPLGIHRLRSFLIRNGIDCDAVDPTIEEIPPIADYDIIGYSVLGWSVKESIAHANALDLREDQIVIFGGYEATFNYMNIIDKCTIDDVAFALGEAEDAMLHLAKTKSRDAYPGIIWARGGAVQNLTLGKSLTAGQFADVTINTDYESIPFPDYWRRNEARIGDDFDPYETRVIRLYVKNRCGFTCDFCSSANFHTQASGEKPPVITINPITVTDLLVRLVKAFPDVRTFFFQDDEIFAPKTFIKGLLEEINSRPELEEIEFICQGRIDAIHPSLLPLMKDAGFRTAILGLENFNQSILSELAPGKLVGYKNYTEKVGTLLEWQIMPFINIILTTPGARLEDVIENIECCIKELERGCELGMNLYTNNWAGSAMAARPEYEVEGFNFLPADLTLRKLIRITDSTYERFREWALGRYTRLNMKSSTRSLLFLMIMSLLIRREDLIERCRNMFPRFNMLPEIPEQDQAAAIEYGLSTVLIEAESFDVDTVRLPFPMAQEESSRHAAYRNL